VRNNQLDANTALRAIRNGQCGLPLASPLALLRLCEKLLNRR
jgi:hypothetical protein